MRKIRYMAALLAACLFSPVWAAEEAGKALPAVPEAQAQTAGTEAEAVKARPAAKNSADSDPEKGKETDVRSSEKRMKKDRGDRKTVLRGGGKTVKAEKTRRDSPEDRKEKAFRGGREKSRLKNGAGPDSRAEKAGKADEKEKEDSSGGKDGGVIVEVRSYEPQVTIEPLPVVEIRADEK